MSGIRAGTFRAPFVFFGGKARVWDLVWEALGDVHHYIEPFAGSLGVLLNRPAHHERSIHTLNDINAFICNFWRASLHDPVAVATWADAPINEVDLHARHRWLVTTGRERVERLREDPDYFDAKVAGWWVWGLNAWIGSGWCAKADPTSRIPVMSGAGQGTHRLSIAEQGTKPPNVGHAGHGTHGKGVVTSKLPAVGRLPGGTERQDVHATGLVAYFEALRLRLRRARVTCGEWDRVVTDGVTSTACGPTVGVFLDPPYDVETSDSDDLYGRSTKGVSAAARTWALSKGDDPRFRIVLAGYEPEHAPHMPPTWRMIEGRSTRAYGTAATSGEDDVGNNANRKMERLWLSPMCARPVASSQTDIFG